MSKNKVERKQERKQDYSQLPDFSHFIIEEEIEDYKKVTVNKVAFSKRVKLAFWFLRIYIAIMIILVIVGFAHV